MSSPTSEPYHWIEKSLWHISPCGSLDPRLLISLSILCAHVKISPLSAIGCLLRPCVVAKTPSSSRSHTSNLNSIHLLSRSQLSKLRKRRLEGSTYVATCKWVVQHSTVIFVWTHNMRVVPSRPPARRMILGSVSLSKKGCSSTAARWNKLRHLDGRKVSFHHY